MVYLKNETDLSVIKTIRYICDHKVTWEHYKKSPDHLTMCSRCLKYNHSSFNVIKSKNVSNAQLHIQRALVQRKNMKPQSVQIVMKTIQQTIKDAVIENHF